MYHKVWPLSSLHNHFVTDPRGGRPPFQAALPDSTVGSMAWFKVIRKSLWSARCKHSLFFRPSASQWRLDRANDWVKSGQPQNVIDELRLPFTDLIPKSISHPYFTKVNDRGNELGLVRKFEFVCWFCWFMHYMSTTAVVDAVPKQCLSKRMISKTKSNKTLRTSADAKEMTIQIVRKLSFQISSRFGQ